MKIEKYKNHFILYAQNCFGEKQFHVYQENGLRIIDLATSIEKTKHLVDELIAEKGEN